MLLDRYAALEVAEAAIGDWSRLLGDVLAAYVATQTEVLALRRLYRNDSMTPLITASKQELSRLLELRVRVMSKMAEQRALLDDRVRPRDQRNRD
jgi:hypothetical protein